MLLMLFLHVFITISCLWAGYLYYRLINGNTKSGKHFIIHAINGLIILTLLTQLSALFIPIGNVFSLLLFLLLILSAVYMRKTFTGLLKNIFSNITRLSVAGKICLVCLWLIVLMLNTGPLIMDDTESYHIQMVQWIEAYGSVPGIANLHERYGFNSSWFSSVAVFHFSFRNLNTFTALNGALSLWFCLYFAEIGFHRYKKENVSLCFAALVTLLFSFASWPVIRGNAATVNYDYITMLVILVLCIETYLCKAGQKDFDLLPEWLIWPVYLFTVRIINYPLLLLSIFAIIYLLKNKKWYHLSSFTIIALLLMLPFLTRNIIVSGYPFYPSPFLDYFNVDWKTPPEVLEHLLRFIKYYNRVSTGILDIETTASLNGMNWIPLWFKYMTVYDQLIFLPGIAGIIIYGISIWRNGKKEFSHYRILTMSLILFLTSWFCIAPDPRFIYGFLIAGIFFLFNSINRLLNAHIINKMIYTVTIILMLCIAPYIVYKHVENYSFKNCVIPASLPQPAVKEKQIGEIIVRIPEKINGNWNPRCYGTPLPCLYSIYPGLEARGKTIREGFRINKLKQ
ncbi:LIC_10190 family membrane protein [Agriterribacter humi]|uniref:LIC_10190 family membrane protein n=1 Tax=Agriterribacter humi TaxID=1104781 RepID=UPI001264048C|nr:hypothetical protein [Agriterribacter humi]